jgi:hypothetical protein
VSDLKKVLIASDFQLPFIDKRATSLWFKVLKSFKPDQVVYAGDIDDACAYGRWTAGGTYDFVNALPSAPTGDDMLRKTFEYAGDTRTFYSDTREAIGPDADMFSALGNHDIRYLKYFDDKNLHEIQKQVNPESLWGLDSIGCEYITYADRPKHLWGGFHVHHGMSISKHAGESVRNDVDNFGVSLIRGHSHRQGIYHKTYTLRNETLTGVELGHFMDVDSKGASYDNVHNWQLGFGVAWIEDNPRANTIDGKFAHIDLVRISPDYTCVVAGKKYSA